MNRWLVIYGGLTVWLAMSCVVADTTKWGKRENIVEYEYSLVPTDNASITSLSDLKDGVYSIQLSGERPGCRTSTGPEYFGFNNRTCSTKISPRTTAGPVMRGPSESMLWREWMIRVHDTQSEESEMYKTVSVQAFVHPDVEGDARCLGFASTFYGSPEFKGTCALPPYGNALFLNSTQDDSRENNSQMWKIRQVDEATGSFEMIASDKPDACLRILAAEDCRSQPALVDTRIISSPESKKYTSWKIFKRYDLAPKASPPPPSPPPSPPLPSLPLGPASGPVISAASSTKSGYVVVNIENVGGDNRCSVSSITLTSIGSALGSLPQTVEVAAPMPAISAKGVYVPVVQYGYNSVYAIGRCNNGETTEQSNVLAVFFARDVGTVPGAPMSVSAGNITATSAIISWLDGNLGDPEERYSVTCVPSSVSTCGDPGVSVTDIPRGDETVLVSGLSSNTNYSCWVKSMNNEGERCSSQPAIFETPHEWALGQLGESCDQACSKTGRICNHEPQRDIVTLHQYSFVANLLDVQVFSNTYNCQGLACEFPEIPGFQPGLNGINSGVSNCVGSRNGVQRFCCCGPSATCPVA